ncbi:hypothetical protein FRC08_016344 [Ceratobasidium sp. 394]|nr:hypothetical protein FRC08_016344 [Ceratobasidium sp. 394]
MLNRLVTNRSIVEGVAHATKSPVFRLAQEAMSICEVFMNNPDTQNRMNEYMSRLNISFTNPRDLPMTLPLTGAPSFEPSYVYVGLHPRSGNYSQGRTLSNLSEHSLDFHSPGSTFATVSSQQLPRDPAANEAATL